MSYPADPKSIQVRDRIVEVLRDIVQGDGYFMAPGAVCDNWKHWKEQEAYPALEVWFGPGGEWTDWQGLQAAETFVAIVHGRVKDDEDAPGAMRKCLCDVRKAVMADAAGGVAESLSTLCLRVKVGETRTDNGQEAALGFGWFQQEFLVTISGKIEDL